MSAMSMDTAIDLAKKQVKNKMNEKEIAMVACELMGMNKIDATRAYYAEGNLREKIRKAWNLKHNKDDEEWD